SQQGSRSPMKKTAHTKRSARLLRCLYCPMEFTKGSGEHVILSALGGRKESRSACCQACNKRLGDEVDKPLAEALRFVCNLLSITTGRGKAAPTIRRVDSGRGYNLDLRPGMTPRVSNARVESTDLPGGKVHVRIR